MTSSFTNAVTVPRLCAIAGAVLVLIGFCWVYSVESAKQAQVAAVDAIGGPVLEVGTDGVLGAEAEGMLVRVSGPTVVPQALRDVQFGVVAARPILERHVEMLQWREIDLGAGATSYLREWVDHPIDSRAFKKPERHENSGTFPFPPLRYKAADVRIDGVKLGPAIVDAIPGSETLLPRFSTMPANLTSTFQLYEGALYTSNHPNSPSLGDLRVSWEAVPSRVLTVLGLFGDGELGPAPGLPPPGYAVLVDDVDLDGILPGLPNAPGRIWWQRALALALALLGVMLLQFGLRRRLDVLSAVGMAVVPLALLGGLIWLSTRWIPALALLALALAAAALVWQRWRSTT